VNRSLARFRRTRWRTTRSTPHRGADLFNGRREYRAGKTGLLGFFVGQVMRQSGGNANPALVSQLVWERLRGDRPSF
jgi:hypothetical protein